MFSSRIDHVRPLAQVVCVAVLFLVAAASAVAQPDIRQSPDDVLVEVAADHARLPPGRADYSRYISLRNFDTKAKRDENAKLVASQLNALSRRPGIAPLISAGDRRLAGDAPAVVRVSETLLRIYTPDFGPVFAWQWERLGAVDPFWHGSTLIPTDGFKVEEYGFWISQDGSRQEGGSPKDKNAVWVTTREERVPTDRVAIWQRGFFLRTEAGREAFKAIMPRFVDYRSKLPGTDTPVVDADWLIGQVSVSFGRDPGYHDFLGFNNLKEWEALVGLVRDPKIVDAAFLTELLEAVAESTVTQKETLRRIVHLDKPGGDVWLTLDTNQRVAKFNPVANPLESLGDEYVKLAQAIEALGHLSNGYVAMGLFNAQDGKRQDVAPDTIASDNTAPFADRRVHEGLCMRCHVSGFQPLKSWIRDVQNYRPNAVGTKDEKKRRQLQDSYVTRRLEPYLDGSRTRYANAVNETAGWTPLAYSAALKATWKDYVEDAVTVDMAARRLGVTTERFKRAIVAADLADKLKAAGKDAAEIELAVYDVTSKMDPKLGVFRKGEALSAVLFQQGYQRFADAIYGVARPYSVKEK